MIKHFELNENGRDFVVGDIHGCFPKLANQLLEIGFKPECDRLFSVGDLVDRGNDSEDVHKWLDKPWFHAVRGNHEQMAINVFRGLESNYVYMRNGGAWFIGLTHEEQAAYVDMFESLPILIDVQTKTGLAGIVHAEYPFEEWAHDVDLEGLEGRNKERFEDICLWSRSRINHNDDSVIHGIDRIYVGHTPLDNPVILGNTIYIDTGAVFGNQLTIVEI
jgi:serine/threonine protein phosphatase 1